MIVYFTPKPMGIQEEFVNFLTGFVFCLQKVFVMFTIALYNKLA